MRPVTRDNMAERQRETGDTLQEERREERQKILETRRKEQGDKDGEEKFKNLHFRIQWFFNSVSHQWCDLFY